MGRQPRTLLEWTLALSAAERHGADRQVTRWSAQTSVVRSTPKAMRVSEFITMWAVAKSVTGEDVTTEIVAEFWGMNERTAYRRLKEFREVWGPPALTRQYDTPDELADGLIAEAARLKRKLSRDSLASAFSWGVRPAAELAV